jgi:ribonucleotide reductase beta subunit family protein with ferritin-like domain
MPGLGQSNLLISRDEALHTTFAMFLGSLILPEHQLSEVDFRAIVDFAVGIAGRFMDQALPEPLVNMNAGMAKDYIQVMANNILVLGGLQPTVVVDQPFNFMKQINLDNRTNFFERRATEYSRVVAGPVSVTADPDEDGFGSLVDF